ncbi:rod shape-determining protein RodA [Nonomuraea sediminis]|uniref:rod shape-determining protein RodA n=1 Tax=Nonomuraea sediminis TaxID=2835864 RepID=UPI0027E0651D|nr:rod shape-determining protein RodA [Nonomuraea sediminis]
MTRPRFDWVLCIASIALCVVGMVLVGAAAREPREYLIRQGLSIALGLALMVGLTFVDHRLLRAYTPVAYLLVCVGLLLVITPIGRTVNGARSWIPLFGLQLQPSELAKLTLVLGLATILSELPDGQHRPRLPQLLLAMVVAAVPAGLIALQPDLGTVLILAATAMGATFLSRVSLRWIFAFVAAGVAAAVLAWQVGLLRPHQVQRVMAFAEPSNDQLGAGYTAHQALVTIGSGGAFGRGLFNGDQTGGGFVPEQHTDFIFTVAGEELGFAGAGAILALLALVLWRGLRIAGRAETPFGTVAAAGIVCWLGVQAFVNLGMTLGLVPIVGVPLPFVSYGGSATTAVLVATGVLQSIHRGSTTLAHF